jgi:RNA polymerase sigma-70 factor (ECF subfamily)
MYDRYFIEKLKQKDNSCYTQLFDSYFKPLHRFALGFVGDHDEASDIVQTVFISLYENSFRLSLEANIASWLFTSVRNRCLNFLRDQDVEAQNRLNYPETYEESDNLCSSIDDDELLAKIRTIINTMPDKCREICVCRFYRNMKYPEIAESFSISVNTVKVQIHRAIQKIRKTLYT